MSLLRGEPGDPGGPGRPARATVREAAARTGHDGRTAGAVGATVPMGAGLPVMDARGGNGTVA